MAGDRAAASETGDVQASGVPHGDATRDRFAGTEMGDAQVGG